jgi:PAS domain-containing protein
MFRAGRETGATKVVDDTTVVAVEPIKVYDPRLGKNTSVAMAVVSVDGSLATMGMGEVGVVYSETLILTGLIGGLFLLIMYRLTLKPFQILNEDMDKGLKGDITQVTHEFRFEELNSLWDLINSALQRIPRANGAGGFGAGSGGAEERPEQFLGALQNAADLAGLGLVFCGPDRKIIAMNPMFEELSGIRADSSVGEEIGSVARDQSLGALVQDLFDRAVPGGDAMIEDYEFSGVSCKVHAIACGASGDPAKAFALMVKRSE